MICNNTANNGHFISISEARVYAIHTSMLIPIAIQRILFGVEILVDFLGLKIFKPSLEMGVN